MPEPTSEIAKGIKCTFCYRRSSQTDMPLLMSVMKDGFRAIDPTCGHGRYPVCKQCHDLYFGCPVCGEQCEYT